MGGLGEYLQVGGTPGVAEGVGWVKGDWLRGGVT